MTAPAFPQPFQRRRTGGIDVPHPLSHVHAEAIGARTAMRESSEIATAVVAPDVIRLTWQWIATVAVTADHIHRGALREGSRDPIALALTEAGFAEVYVAVSSIHVAATEYVMCPDLEQWVEAFDAGELVEPFDLELVEEGPAPLDRCARMASEPEF